MYELLRAEVDKQKRLRIPKLTNKDLAKMTGFKTSTINKFMSGHEVSENIANALARELKIKR